MSAYFNAAANDAHDILSGFRTSLPAVTDVVEASILAIVAGFVIVSLNMLF
ncbi:hypothetical protein [Niveispirillum sp.]|uniref:hypothetical protein n=1 Tax=Niveispirillum sp. TaxID=1917217 RepID=UPI001B713DCF|nr:hypothetical protein [Niveispirillum sp.]MBP7336618.1 hypothetical protein [Niveispirillum sp.]